MSSDAASSVANVIANAAPASLSALLVSALGPVAGQVFLVFIGALAGAFWSLGKRDKDAQPGALVFMSRLIVASVVLTSASSFAMQHLLGLPYLDCLLVCSFLLAAFSDLWSRVVVALLSRMTDRQV